MINGYDSLYRAITGPVARSKAVGGFKFETQYEVQGKSPKLSNSAVKNLIQVSDRVTGAGVLSYGTAIIVNTNITPDNLYSESKTLGLDYLAIYQGTSAVGSMQIYPYQGAGATVRDYDVKSGYDGGPNNTTDWNGINTVHTVSIEKLSAGSVDIFVTSQWSYIMENAGTSV